MTRSPERRDDAAPRLPAGARIAIGALALLGTLALMRWVLSRLFGLIAFGVIIVVVVGVLSLAARRR